MITVDQYISNQPEWAQEKLIALRDTMLACGLRETIKWNMPVYMHKRNVLGLGGFKEFVTIWFYNGVFLSDEKNLLTTADDRSKGMRQWRIYKEDNLPPPELIKMYVMEAADNDEKGLKIKPTRNTDPVIVPAILQEVLDAKPEIHELYENLSLAKQREMCRYIDQAKQLETKQRRVQQSIEAMAQNQSVYNKYKK